MQRTRQEILRLLQLKGEQTVRELAEALGLTPMSVRLHLSVLLRDSLVASREVHQAVGRPHFLYRLTEQAEECFPKQYAQLAERMIAAVAARGGQAAVQDLIDDVIQGQAENYAARMVNLPLPGRVAELAAILSEEGFMADWEERDGEYRIRLNNCPYAQVARNHAEICCSELALAEQLMDDGQAGTSLEREKFRLQGDTCCVYRIRRNVESVRA
ncbi:MAG TPA: winged helix-turn-helix transcriptional regulator [Chloroflexota bacterium]|nr:winged helix-turn-helix transcriptional regulator [Chloroflexota bacterium]